ncbi:MAG: hypothetical protein KJ720_15470 [Proteobacteria bacterium]|nr:hypothetical protein [Pseudomonadota bacterium]MBU2470765.1 hypothetical protein [Pseudomonadota bacterium]
MPDDDYTFRDTTTSEFRNEDLYHHIDPGFINYRKCFSAFGKPFLEAFEQNKKTGDDHFVNVENDHIIVDLALAYCKAKGVPTLNEALQNPREGQLFCSSDQLEGNDEVYSAARIRNRVLLNFDYEKDVFVEFHTKHIVADTEKVFQSQTSIISIIGEIRGVNAHEIILHPIIMGAPSYDHPLNQEYGGDVVWFGWNWYENFPEDIDEFNKIKEVGDVAAQEWIDYMKVQSEENIKEKFCDILQDITKKDWGGEQDDLFSTHIHLSGQRKSAAFLLKGPGSGFREMTPDMLGKRGDQIYRLDGTPADLLVVQHCHKIGEAVRATLRAFAVNPSRPRRYCFIDGRDTYRILKAYGKL